MSKTPTRDAILALLERDGPMTANEIAKALGTRQINVDSAIRHARAADRNLMHVHGWKRSLDTKGRMGRIWAAGPGKDAKQLAPLTKEETSRRSYQKHRVAVRLRVRERCGREPLNPMGHMAMALGVRA